MCNGFVEDTINLQSSGDVWKGNNFAIKGLSNRVTINLYMFQALVINRVGIDLDGVGVVSM